MDSNKHAPDMPDKAPTTTKQSKPRGANPRVLQRTERMQEEGFAERTNGRQETSVKAKLGSVSGHDEYVFKIGPVVILQVGNLLGLQLDTGRL